MPEARLFAKIAKVDAIRREVHGILAEEAPDKAKEIFDYAESKPYFQKWNESFQGLTAHLDAEMRSVGNVREMHTKSAAGKFVKMDYDDANKQISVVAKIEDDQAWRKVSTGVYTGFSIGGDYVRKFDDPTVPGHKRYVAMPTEGSLVDNPCMYGATFKLFKSEGDHEVEELVKFVGEGELAKATKRVDGYDLTPECFLIVGDTGDPSTWHLPVHFPTVDDTVRHIQMAMGDLPSVKGVTHQVKSGAARRLNSLARKHGVETKDFATKFLESTYPNALKKCMYSVSTMASMLESLSYLEQNLQYEAESEGDDSKIPAQLRTAIKDLSQIFLDMADEETKELAAKVTREDPATKGTEPNLTKGGGPNMPPTTQNNGTEGQAPDLQPQLAKYHKKVTNINTSLGKLAASMDELRKAQEEIDDALASVSILGKSATPKDHADTFELIKAAAGKIKTHSDQTEAVIEEIEGEVESEADDLTNNQKAVRPNLLLKRQERQFERRFAMQEKMHQATTNALLSGIEKMFAGAGEGQLVKSAEPPAAPARTFVAPDKVSDGAGVGGVVQKAAPAGAPTPQTGGVAAVDNFGMPNPTFVEKADGSQFVEQVKKSQPQVGNPFPKEFGNATIF